ERAQRAAQVRASVADDLIEHSRPDLTAGADYEVRIERGQVGERRRAHQGVALEFEPDGSRDPFAVVIEHANREADLGIAEPAKRLALGFHQAAEGEKPCGIRKRRHHAPKIFAKSVGSRQRGRRFKPAESQRWRYSLTIRRQSWPCSSIPLSKCSTPPPISIAIGSTSSGTLKVCNRIISASSSWSWSSPASSGRDLSCSRRCTVP